MAYITTQEVKQIRDTLKQSFPDFKFSVRREHGTSVQVTITQGPIDFGNNLGQVNPYWFQTHDYTYQQLDFLSAVFKVIQNAGRKYFNESDLQSDYHHVAFYFHLDIGDYRKPYTHAVPNKFKGNTNWAEAADTALAFTKLATA